MSVLIKGMEMPTNCCQCVVNMEVCKRGYRYLLAHPELYDKRADDCPLVEIPPHGRLIDADALSKRMRGVVFRGEEKDVLHHNVQVFLDAPTIIEAEEGEC